MQLAIDHKTHGLLDEATRSVPEIVNSAMSAQQKQQALHDKFYADNPMLAEAKGYVSAISQEVIKDIKASGRSLTPEAILAETEQRAYRALGITKRTNDANQAPEPDRAAPILIAGG